MKFAGARKVSANGVKGIFIPVDENPAIVQGAKGAYANVRVVEKESTFNDRHYTHFIALSLPREKKDDLKSQGYSDERLNGLTPILGNLEEYQPRDTFQEENIQDIPEVKLQDSGDLPF